MTGLRERIEAERAALLDERAIAEAAAHWDEWDDLMEVLGNGQNAEGDTAAHIARQDPTATIARIDRELARIDADLVLLTSAEEWRYKGEFGWGPWQVGEGPDQEGQALDDAATKMLDNLAARYPETEDHA